METLGQYLKKQRELRGVTLNQIADITKINPTWLNAIEKDAFDTMPGFVFAKGFVKSYAKCIGLDVGEVSIRFDEVYLVDENKPKEKSKPEKIGEGFISKLIGLIGSKSKVK
ncbi:helix-turn-helix domain-containing protein [bacterium]|nr:helix-turn-helix domain-containing protein [bacterium]